MNAINHRFLNGSKSNSSRVNSSRNSFFSFFFRAFASTNITRTVVLEEYVILKCKFTTFRNKEIKRNLQINAGLLLIGNNEI